MASHSIAVQVSGVRIAANLEPRVLLVHFSARAGRRDRNPHRLRHIAVCCLHRADARNNQNHGLPLSLRVVQELIEPSRNLVALAA